MEVMFVGVAAAVHVRARIFASLRKLRSLNIHSVCACACVCARNQLPGSICSLCIHVCVLGGGGALMLGKEKQT